MRNYIILFLLLTGAVLSAKAQKPELNNTKSKSDSIYRKIDSANSKPFVPRVKKEKIYHPDTLHSPHKAVLRSALIPGWGQLYNKHGWWWKVPAIYGGLGSLGYWIVTSERDYQMYLGVAKFQRVGLAPSDPRLKDPQFLSDNKLNGKYLDDYTNFTSRNISSDAIIAAKDGSLRNRDISILSFMAVWAVNVIDAYIDAKFTHSFSMDNNFNVSLGGAPVGQPVYASNFNTFTPTLKITFTLK